MNPLKFIQKMSEQYTSKAQKRIAYILRKELMQNYKPLTVVNSVTCTLY
jgi:hypothetical protein